MLFKQLADVDSFPICLDTQDTEQIIATIKAIAPGFGGINLEDISSPRCFEIEQRLREELDIPVFHDDQHGTAVVLYAALINALKIVNKSIHEIKVVVCGIGAAGIACIKFYYPRGSQTSLAWIGKARLLQEPAMTIPCGSGMQRIRTRIAFKAAYKK